MKKLNVLHIASFNGNIGDNANHNGFRRKLDQFLNCEVNYDEIEMREFYQSWNIRDFNSKEFIEKCNEYDLLIIGGGNFFELKWDYSHTGTTVNLSNETLEKIDTPILFFGVGCDIAKGVTESTINKFENFLNNITNSNKYLISVRNDGSYNTIQKLYGDKFSEKIHKVADGAFFLKTQSFNFPELNEDLKSIGLNIVSDMKEIRFNEKIENGITYNDFIVGLSKVVNTFLEQNDDYQIILFPHIYSDLSAINELLERINDKLRRTRIVVAPCLTGKGSEEYIFGLYNECDFIMGMRFHSNVAAIAQNIPTIGLSSYKKIIDLYSEINLLERVVDVNKKGFEERLKSLIEETIEDSKKVKLKYEKVNEKISEQYANFFQLVKEWAEENNII